MAVPERMSAVPGTTIDIDVMGNDVKFNCETISLLGITQPDQGCSAMIVVGAGPSGRNIVRFTSPNLAATTVTFNYTIAELSGTQATATVTIDLTPMRLPENPTGDTPGMATQYYILSAPTVLPNFIALTSYSTTSVAQMNFDSTSGNFATSNRADGVGAVFTGWLNVPTAGTWTLYTNSDDGSRLLIGTTQVVTNDGLHGMVEKSGTVDLALASMLCVSNSSKMVAAQAYSSRGLGQILRRLSFLGAHSVTVAPSTVQTSIGMAALAVQI